MKKWLMIVGILAIIVMIVVKMTRSMKRIYTSISVHENDIHF